MRCHNDNCPITENLEEIRFFQGEFPVRIVHTCSHHKTELLKHDYHSVSGIAFKIRPQFQPMVTSGSGPAPYVPPNQSVTPIQASGSANVPTSEAAASQYQGATANLFPPLVSQINVSTPGAYTDVDFLAFISGNTVTVINPITNTVVGSGNNATAVLTSAMSLLGQFQTLHINRGVYEITTPIFLTYNLSGSNNAPGYCTIAGNPSPWSAGGTVLRAGSGNQPIFVISGGHHVCIQNIFFQTNFSGYTHGLIEIVGNAFENEIKDIGFWDTNTSPLSGCCISLHNGGGPAGPTQNLFNSINSEGFNCVIRSCTSGGGSGVATATPYVNGNIFTNFVSINFGDKFCHIIGSSGSTFDANIFSNIQLEGGAGLTPTLKAFDYATQMSGTSNYNKHIGVVCFDLNAGGVYAQIRPNTQLDLMSCTPDYLMSGIGLRRHYGLLTDDRMPYGQPALITSSGNGTTSWFIPWNTFVFNGINQVPSLVMVNAANSGTATAGTPFVLSGTGMNLSGFTVNTPNAVNSGVALSWNWHAYY